MADTLRLACIQLCSGTDVDENVRVTEGFVREAAGAGAQLIATPEMTSLLAGNRAELQEKARPQEEDTALPRFQALANDLGVWLLLGSLPVLLEDGRAANRSFLIDAGGRLVAAYDKIHMFDVDLDGGESYRESASYRPGEKAVLADTPWGPLGLTICYDMRFPYLYRDLAQAGARLISVPSAFTRPTGAAHWEVLLRARAIETGAFIFAPAQTGEHQSGRKTYGHSLIVAPWGEVLADGGTETGVTLADLDFAKVDAARKRVPSLSHDRSYEAPAKPASVRAVS